MDSQATQINRGFASGFCGLYARALVVIVLLACWPLALLGDEASRTAKNELAIEEVNAGNYSEAESLFQAAIREAEESGTLDATYTASVKQLANQYWMSFNQSKP